MISNLTLIKFSITLKNQRKLILKKSKKNFLSLLNDISPLKYSMYILNKMESGQPVSILYWVYVWDLFQNTDKILAAYNEKEMLFLSSQNFDTNIEDLIIRKANEQK